MVFPNLTNRRSRKRGVEYSVSSTSSYGHSSRLATTNEAAKGPVVLGPVDRMIDTITS